jgi:dTDP-glucose pyrophosphorylase
VANKDTASCLAKVKLPMCEPRLKICSVEESATIKDAMLVLDRGFQIAFIVDNQGKLLGTCTDGDVRRALLAGFDFNSPIIPHMECKFVSVGPESERAQVLDLMKARHIQQVPVLSAEGVLVGLHLLRELIGSVERPNWAVLMAGGKGSRLHPLTNGLPKPMIPVAGRPILERLVLHLVGYGIRRIFLSINYLGGMVESHFGDGSQYGCSIEYLREDRPLGTGGSLGLLPEIPDRPLIVMNGDLVTGINIDELLAHHGHEKYVATLGIREYCHTVPFGAVDIQNGRLRRISEKPTYSWMVNTGCYVLDPCLISRVPKNTECTIPTLIENALTRGEQIGVYTVTQDWIDIGRIPDLARALGRQTSEQMLEQPTTYE